MSLGAAGQGTPVSYVHRILPNIKNKAAAAPRGDKQEAGKAVSLPDFLWRR